MISIDIKNEITIKEVNDSVFTAGVGHKIYKFFGIKLWEKTYNEKLLPESKADAKESIGFTKKR